MKIYLFSMIFLFFCLLGGCGPDGQLLRVKNTSGMSFEGVMLNKISFGKLDAGKSSVYKSVDLNRKLLLELQGVLIKNKKETLTRTEHRGIISI